MRFLFGSKEKFAISLSYDEMSIDEWLNGDVQIYIDGNILNRNDQYVTSMIDIANEGGFKVFDCGRRRSKYLCSLDKEDIFRYLYGILYDDNPGDEAVGEPARFDISINVDLFDHVRLFAIECDECDRLIYRVDAQGAILEKILDFGYVSLVISGFYGKLDELCSAIYQK